MRVANHVQIQNLVKRLFRETYGVEDDTLYQDAELRERIRGAVKELRLSYQNSTCITNYDAEEIRKAYMIAYYPYFIVPAGYVVSNHVVPHAQAEAGNWTFFAAGPCPELLGVARIRIFRTPPPKRVITLDREKDWFPYQKLTRNLCEEYFGFERGLKFYHSFNIGDMNQLEDSNSNVKPHLRDTNLFFMQNYLSHLPDTPQNVNNFLNWFSTLARMAKPQSFFVFVDLNYNSTSTVFSKLVNAGFLESNGLKKIAAHIPTDGEPYEFHHQGSTQAISDNIFTGEFGLLPKFLTKFYFVVLQKEGSI